MLQEVRYSGSFSWRTWSTLAATLRVIGCSLCSVMIPGNSPMASSALGPLPSVGSVAAVAAAKAAAPAAIPARRNHLPCSCPWQPWRASRFVGPVVA